MKRMARRAAVVAAVGLGVVAAHEEHAEACGACYASLSESTVVNDHKMALSISPNATILWDQISYSGNPREFAYVVPVRAGAYVEASHDAWFQALDASTRPILMAPPGLYSGGGSGRDDGAGCSPGCSDSLTASAYDSASGSGPPPVQVVSQSVVGPYETVTLRSDDPDALQKWLVAHDFAIPESSEPIIFAYVAGKFDFLALRLRPGNDVRSIEPIRIVSPGADLTLPLRMMQIGAASSLGITLYVLSDGRYHPKTFPDATIDFEKLVWDTGQNRTNYQELSLAAMKEKDARGFLTEYSDLLTSTASRAAAPGMTGNPSLENAYETMCSSELAKKRASTSTDGQSDAAADAVGDAGLDGDSGHAGDAGDAGGPAERADAGGGRSPSQGDTCDDLRVALDGMVKPSAVWITRMRADLPYAALADTLVLEPYPTQTPVPNIHTAKDVGTISSARIAPRTPRRYGSYVTVALTALVLGRILRRRRAPPRTPR